MSDAIQGSLRPHPLRILASLYVEFTIIIVCALIISEAGQTRGPVFDVVGPDFLPTVVAGLVAALTLLQMGVQVARQVRGKESETSEPIAGSDAFVGLVFAAVTTVFVTTLALRLVPFWAATAVFVTVATLLLARTITRRDLVLSISIGIGLGVALQLIFTRILIIDLPT